MNREATTATSAPTKNRTTVLVGLMCAMGLAAMDNTIVGTAIPSIVKDLGGFSLFPWVFSIYLLVQAATIPIYGKLADLYGRKPVVLVGIGIFLLGSVLSGLSWNMLALIVFRGLQGIGAGAVQPIATTIVGDIYTVEERAKIQGYLSSVWGIASVVGPGVGGLLVEFISWRWIFYINLPIGAAAFLILSSYFHESERRHRIPTIDYRGSALLLFGIGIGVLGLLEGGVAWPWMAPVSLGIFAFAALVLAVFILSERSAKEPVLPLWVFQHRMLLGANLGGLMIGALTVGISSFLPTFLQGDLGATPLVAGFTLAALSIAWPLASAVSGTLYLRIGFRQTALVGAVLSLVSGVLFVWLHASASITMVAVDSFIMGAGLGFGSSAIIVGVQSAVAWNQRGVVTGSNMFMRQLGSTLGVAIFGSFLNSTLASWFAHPPAKLAGHLPHSLNATSLLLGGHVTGLTGPAAQYIRQGLYLGIHRIFWAVVAVAVFEILFVLIMPRWSGQIEEQS